MTMPRVDASTDDRTNGGPIRETMPGDSVVASSVVTGEDAKREMADEKVSVTVHPR